MERQKELLFTTEDRRKLKVSSFNYGVAIQRDFWAQATPFKPIEEEEKDEKKKKSKKNKKNSFPI